MAGATALWAGVQAFVFLSPWPTGNENDPASAKIALFLLSNPVYVLVLLICVAFLIAGWRERRSSGRPPRRSAPDAVAGRPGTRPQSAPASVSADRPRSPAPGRSWAEPSCPAATAGSWSPPRWRTRGLPALTATAVR